MRNVGVAMAVLLVLSISVDPFTYATHFSYDDFANVWWKAVLAAIDAGLILVAALLLWRANARAAAHAAAADTALAATLGLAIGHGDLIRLALEGWIPAQGMLVVYLGSLLLRVFIFAVAWVEHKGLTASETRFP